MTEELRPYIREYGGGDDRWCWHRTQFTTELWDFLCDGHGEEFTFAEYGTEMLAWLALGEACRKLGGACNCNPIPPIRQDCMSDRRGRWEQRSEEERLLEEVRAMPCVDLKLIHDKQRNGTRLTKREVMILRCHGAVFGGCCDRFADMSGCDCLERARDG